MQISHGAPVKQRRNVKGEFTAFLEVQIRRFQLLMKLLFRTIKLKNCVCALLSRREPLPCRCSTFRLRVVWIRCFFHTTGRSLTWVNTACWVLIQKYFYVAKKIWFISTFIFMQESVRATLTLMVFLSLWQYFYFWSVKVYLTYKEWIQEYICQIVY